MKIELKIEIETKLYDDPALFAGDIKDLRDMLTALGKNWAPTVTIVDRRDEVIK